MTAISTRIASVTFGIELTVSWREEHGAVTGQHGFLHFTLGQPHGFKNFLCRDYTGGIWGKITRAIASDHFESKRRSLCLLTQTKHQELNQHSTEVFFFLLDEDATLTDFRYCCLVLSEEVLWLSLSILGRCVGSINWGILTVAGAMDVNRRFMG